MWAFVAYIKSVWLKNEITSNFGFIKLFLVFGLLQEIFMYKIFSKYVCKTANYNDAKFEETGTSLFAPSVMYEHSSRNPVCRIKV